MKRLLRSVEDHLHFLLLREKSWYLGKQFKSMELGTQETLPFFSGLLSYQCCGPATETKHWGMRDWGLVLSMGVSGLTDAERRVWKEQKGCRCSIGYSTYHSWSSFPLLLWMNYVWRLTACVSICLALSWHGDQGCATSCEGQGCNFLHPAFHQPIH